MIKIVVKAGEVISGLETKKSMLKNSLFAALVQSTALARSAVIDNIKHGMKKGLGWPPFSPSTIRRKARRGRSLEALVDTGQMMGSVHESTSRTKMEGVVYPGVAYLKYHERGTRRMKSRPIMAPVPKQINRQIMEIFKSEIAKGLAI